MEKIENQAQKLKRPKNWNFLQQERKGVKGFKDRSNLDEENAFDREPVLVFDHPLGTFVSAFTVLCGARTDLPDRHMCCVFWLNIAAALIQILTAIVMVGWIMSIFWGMDMVILAISQGYKEQGIPQQL
ncbi:protein stum homolog [Athene cunicularia]|uniref:protein stum homolog n=1 Tax=Athene cunicularia TaxID=194338 RepID=UPI000EF74507|nr:protein stum homolog [Athene cunicularia]